MTGRIVVFERTGPTGSFPWGLVKDWREPYSLLMCSAWCGLVSGLLAVGIIFVRKRTLDFNQLYWMSRHFVWLIPLIYLAIFLVMGVFLSVLVRGWSGRGRWLATRVLSVLSVLPLVWAALPRIYGPAGFLV